MDDALPDPPDPSTDRYGDAERRPVEVLVFEVDPADVDEFLRTDHEVWTLGEAATPGTPEIPFQSKEVWLSDDRPGEITIVFVWPDRAAWDHVGDEAYQQLLTAEFERRFTRPYRLVRAIHEERSIQRWSRFERAKE